MSISIKLQGGLGNRLFQVASGYAIAKDMNKSFHISTICDSYNKHSNINYFNTILRNVPINNNISNYYTFNEPGNCGVTWVSIPNTSQNILLNGYFQSEIYFKKYKSDIYNLFRIDEHIKSYLNTKYSDLENKYFIHIRRGDYLSVHMHNVNLESYYIKCLKLLPSDVKLMVFSDDINYCRQHIMFTGKNVEFVENENELDSMYLMSMCRLGGIVCNSSFSWWGSYLNDNPNKTVFFPDKWFNNDWNVDIGFEGCNIVSVSSYDNIIITTPVVENHVPMHYNPNLKNLTDTTFLIAFRIDHDDRFINLGLQLKYLLSNFNTNFIIFEDGPSQHFTRLINSGQITEDHMKNIDYEYTYNNNEFFHRMQNINKCLAKVKTKVCVNLDIDVLIPIDYYIDAQNKILNMEYDVIHPFNNPPGVYLIHQNDKKNIILNDIRQIRNKCTNGKAGNGFLIFFRTSEYIRMGGESEEFKSFGPEDDERICRAIYNGLKYGRLDIEVYHLEHYRGPNSSNSNPYFNHNCQYWNTMKSIYTNSNNNPHYMKVLNWLNTK